MIIKYFDINKNVCNGKFLRTDKNQFNKTVYIVEAENEIAVIPERFVISIENDNTVLNETLLHEINLTVRTYNVLKRAGFISIEEVAETDLDTLVTLKNISLKVLKEIAVVIENINSALSFKICEYVEIQKKVIYERLHAETLQVEIDRIIDINKKRNNRKVNLLINLAINQGASTGEKENAINLCKNILGL